MCWVGRGGGTGTSVGDPAAPDWTVSEQKERPGAAQHCAQAHPRGLLSLGRGTQAPVISVLLWCSTQACGFLQKWLMLLCKDLRGEENSKWGLIHRRDFCSQLYPVIQRKRNCRLPGGATQESKESKAVTSVSADTLIPTVIRIRDFKFRKSHTQLGFM